MEAEGGGAGQQRSWGGGEGWGQKWGGGLVNSGGVFNLNNRHSHPKYKYSKQFELKQS